MVSKISSKLKIERKDGEAKGSISKGVSVTYSSGRVTTKSYVRKRKK